MAYQTTHMLSHHFRRSQYILLGRTLEHLAWVTRGGVHGWDGDTSYRGPLLQGQET